MTNQKRLQSGRTAVVTGAAPGLGEFTAKELAARGVDVALLGLKENALVEVATELPTTSRCWGADLTHAPAMARVAKEVPRLMGRFRSSWPTREWPKLAHSATRIRLVGDV
ncbi:SDR family NAD(P)-dependent oxidoreductase [Streptomyces sp. NPDC088755]|uniref:SDR family NAD(P)-dependent oxidoreductase n=1 Tax=Streptomyces sp. NPDC088755 TaxID=3365888 RepID=UPI00381E9946